MSNQVQLPVTGPRLVSDRTVAFIEADYQEFKPETFKGYTVRVGAGGGPSKHFKTTDEAGDFARDQGAETVFLLSSCDNYESDRKRFA